MRMPRHLLNVGFNVVFWVFLFTFIFAVRYYGLATIEALQTDVVLAPSRIYGNGVLSGVLVAVPYTLMELYLRDKGLYEFSLARIMLNRTLVQFGIAAVVLTILAYANYRVITTEPAPGFRSTDCGPWRMTVRKPMAAGP